MPLSEGSSGVAWFFVWKGRVNHTRKGDLMKSYDVVGYVDDCYIFCTDCGDSTMEPIFAGSEWDYYPVCEECGREIDVILTEDGIKYEERQAESLAKDVYFDLVKEPVDFVVNPNDLMPKPFWKGVFVVRIGRFGTSFLVNADHEADALDMVIDYIEDHSDQLGGLLLTYKQEEEYEEEGRLVDYYCGGNGSRYLSTHNFRIESFKL